MNLENNLSERFKGVARTKLEYLLERGGVIVASNDLLAEKCDDLAKRLADKIMRYLGKQVCLDEEITIGDIEALISNDLMVILTANTLFNHSNPI